LDQELMEHGSVRSGGAGLPELSVGVAGVGDEPGGLEAPGNIWMAIEVPRGGLGRAAL
jgi:hypothetical protein